MRKGLIKKIVIGVVTSLLAMCFFGVLTSTFKKDPCVDHEWDDGVLAKESTCYATGLKVYTCEVCGTEKNEKIAKKAHAYVAGEVIIPKTCKDNGIQEFTCSICQKTVEENIGLGAHTYEVVASEPVSPTTEGYEIHECTSCGDLRRVNTGSMVKAVEGMLVADRWFRIYRPDEIGEDGVAWNYLTLSHSLVDFVAIDNNYCEGAYTQSTIFYAGPQDGGILNSVFKVVITEEYIDFCFVSGEYSYMNEHVIIREDSTITYVRGECYQLIGVYGD